MSKSAFYASVILLTLLLLPVLPVRSQTYTPGVSVGDWGTFAKSGNAPTFINVTSFNITVTQVSGVNVTLQRTAYFQNGTHLIQTGWINIQNGSTSLPPNNFTFILTSKGLTVHEFVYQGQPLFINRTVYAPVAGLSRNVNYVDLQRQNYAAWDQNTGFIVGFNISVGGSYLMATMQKTNMWSAPRTPLGPIQLLVASLFPCMLVLWRRRRN